MNKPNLLIIGGGGYVGTELVTLLHHDYNIIVYDLFLYGDHIKEPVKKIKCDVRDYDQLENAIKGVDYIIHLACISNDPSFELNPNLSKSINHDAFIECVKIAKRFNIKNFIFASSSSVYGVKDEKNVTEDLSLEPLTDYSLYKGLCEKILLNESNDKFISTILRPATVAGYSKRQRLDVIVNILSNHAFFNNHIIIHGGKQLRPNIHIEDMCNAYKHILNSDPKLIKDEIFNVGFENHSLNDLGQLVVNNINEEVKISIQDTNDNRSYHICSEKIRKKLEFEPKKNIEIAIKDLINAFKNKLLINTFENPDFYNIKKMQLKNLQ